MKKLLFFINSLGGGGAEKVLVDLLNSLDSQQYDIDLISVTGGIHENRLSKNINYNKIIKCKNGFLNKLFGRLFFHLPLNLIYRVIKKREYDVEIAYLEGFPTRVITAGKSNAKKVAFVHCDVSVHGVLDSFYKNYDECLSEYNRLDKVCFVSQLAKDGFEKTIGHVSNGMVLHNVIDFDDVKEKSKEKNDCCYSTKGVRFIAVGRLSREKGYSRLIDIIGELEKKYNFELWLIGDGPEKEKIENKIKDKRISSVKLLGFQKNPYSFIKKADFLVCPSYYEGYSTVVAETLSLGIPVITTDCAGMNELLDGEKYGIITENSFQGLKQGLVSVLEDCESLKRYKDACLAHSEDFSINDSVKQYDELFTSIE